MTKKLIL